MTPAQFGIREGPRPPALGAWEQRTRQLQDDRRRLSLGYRFRLKLARWLRRLTARIDP